jgi:hypothetical protein
MDRSETLRRACLDDIRLFVERTSSSRYSMRRLAGATMLMPLLAMKRDTMLIYGVEEPGVSVLP